MLILPLKSYHLSVALTHMLTLSHTWFAMEDKVEKNEGAITGHTYSQIISQEKLKYISTKRRIRWVYEQ